MNRKWVFGFVSLFLLIPAFAYSAGFFTPEIGAKSVARGGATIASCDDLTALYLNPGALSRVKGSNLLLQNNFDVMHSYYRKEPYLPGVWNRNPLDHIPYFAASSDFRLEDWTFAFGLYGPYGVTQRYPSNGPQRYTVLEANSVQIYYALGVGWHPLNWLRIGANAMITQFSKEDYYGFSVLKDRNSKYDVEARFLAESDYLPTWSAGVILEPVNWFHVGFSYIAPSEPDLKGSLSAEMPEFYAAILGYDFYDDKITVGISYPEQFRGGVRFIFRDIWDVEAAFSYIPWSSLISFPVDLEQEILIEDFDLFLLWEDSWSWRVGSTFKLDDHWQFHAGYFWEEPATPDKTLAPGGIDNIRNAFSGGITLSYYGMDLTFGYAHVFMNDRETGAPDEEGTLDDGRGRYKASYDHLCGAINFNIEKMHYTFKGYNPKAKKESPEAEKDQ